MTRRPYTNEEIDQAMLALAVYAGRTAPAAEALKEQGLTVSARTLVRWRDQQHAATYAKHLNERQADIDNRLQASYLHVIDHATRGTQLAVEKTVEQLEADQARDPAAVARNLATVAGISTDKWLTLQGRPTAHVMTRSVDENLLLLADILGPDVVDAELAKPEITE